MKTAEEWINEGKGNIEWRNPLMIPELLRNLIHAIQNDALRLEESIESPSTLVRQAEINVEYLYEKSEFYKAKWHEARRYLRAANKGAERNAQVMQLQAHTINRLLVVAKPLPSVKPDK